MELFDTLNHISFPPWLSTIMLLIIGGMWAYRAIRRSNTQIDDESIHSLERQLTIKNGEIKTLTDRADSMDLKILQLTKIVGEKDGIITVKNQQLEQYEKILQNRNPELIEILNSMKNLMESLTKESKEGQRELKSQSKILNNIQLRNDSIDRAHGNMSHLDEERNVQIIGKIKEN